MGRGTYLQLGCFILGLPNRMRIPNQALMEKELSEPEMGSQVKI